MGGSVITDVTEGHGFSHQAFLYAGEDEFIVGATEFLRASIGAAEPVLAVVSSRKIDLLRNQLGVEQDAVSFADMNEVGVNPARIIPAWAEFANGHGDRPLRGIGEPIWAGRSTDELVECQSHEGLLNIAFADRANFTLMCPYDTNALPDDVIDEARRTHPFMRQGTSCHASDAYLGTQELARLSSQPLSETPSSCVDLAFTMGLLGEVRSLVRREALDSGFDAMRVADAVAAVNELASNSIRHGGGSGSLRIWRTTGSLICEVSDDGQLDQPLVGRIRPTTGAHDGRGLWIVNHLCELVQVRSFRFGTTVRVHMRR